VSQTDLTSEQVSTGDAYVALTSLADGSATWVHTYTPHMTMAVRYDRDELGRLRDAIDRLLKRTAVSVTEATERLRLA
jgi:hypothetical protein